jgi:hypothetical protein
MNASVNDEHPFTLEHYRALLQAAKESGYRFALFEEPAQGRAVYLRHDVDNSIDDALTIAGAEAELGVRSSFLFLLRSKNYNLLAGDSIAKVRSIAEFGHAVGLHFSREPGDEPAGTPLPLPERIRTDAALMAQAVGLPVRLFSFHNPAGRDEFQVDVPGLINSYAPRFFGDIKYLSESNFRWREGCPCEIFRSGRYPVMQILIHPMTYCDLLRTDRDALLYFLYRKLLELSQANQAQNLTLRQHPVGPEEIAEYLQARAAGPH